MQSGPIATVIIPTHNHGPTLRWSVRSAQEQTLSELEIFIVGDGVPESAREIILRLCAEDPRVRFFDHPKAGRNGEVLRHSALREARGRIVCYLSDDDLWLNHHVETMHHLLAEADFVSALPAYRDTDGSLGGWTVDLALPWYRNLILSGENRVPLTCGAHTMALYRRLPHGWRETPAGTPTDLYMWQQILSMPLTRSSTATDPTVMVFPSPSRAHLGVEDRAAELERWWGEMQAGDFRSRTLREMHLWSTRERLRLEIHGAHAAESLRAMSSVQDRERALMHDLEAQLSDAAARIESLENQVIPEMNRSLAEAVGRIESLELEVIPALKGQIAEGAEYVTSLEREIAVRGAYRERLASEIAARSEQIAALQTELHQVKTTALWRARERLVNTRAASLGVMAARMLSGPGRNGD